jgi:hypothetical protein
MKSIHRTNSAIFVPLLLITSLPFIARPDEASESEQIDPSYYEVDVNRLIDIGVAEDIAAKRRALIRHI